MPNRKNAIIQLRKDAKRTDRNRSIKSNLKTATGEFEKVLSEGNAANSQKALEALQATIDKTSKRGVIPKNRASRMKSRCAAKVNKLAG